MLQTNHDRESFFRKLLQERRDHPDIPIERFCRERGISLWTFYHWRKRLGHCRAPSFLPVTLPQQLQPANGQYYTEITLPVGATIRFPGGFEKEMFRAIVETVSSPEVA